MQLFQTGNFTDFYAECQGRRVHVSVLVAGGTLSLFVISFRHVEMLLGRGQLMMMEMMLMLLSISVIRG